jgi:preprotein translocase subunit SecD
LVVRLPHGQNIPYIAVVISSVGEIKFIDGGQNSPPVGQADAPSQIYQTLFTGQEIESAEPPDSTAGQIFYRLTLQPAASERLATFIQTQPQRYICMVVDGQVLNCSVMYHQAGNTIEILPGLSSGTFLSLADLAIFLESGPLPEPLQAEIR